MDGGNSDIANGWLRHDYVMRQGAELLLDGHGERSNLHPEGAPTRLHLWLTIQVLPEDAGWPLPRLHRDLVHEPATGDRGKPVAAYAAAELKDGGRPFVVLTLAEIEAIRGVQVGPILRTLVDRGMVKVAGRSDDPGHPLLYGTTRKFLDTFALAVAQGRLRGPAHPRARQHGHAGDRGPAALGPLQAPRGPPRSGRTPSSRR